MKSIHQIYDFLRDVSDIFHRPTQKLFFKLVAGWLLCPGRRFVTAMIQFGDPSGQHSHDSYHAFFRIRKWSTISFWKAWTKTLVYFLCYEQTLILIGDDTVHKKTGRKVNGAKYCRDAVHSTKKKVVHCWGLSIILLCLLIQVPWGGEPLSIPINMRLFRKRENKDEPTILDKMAEMILEIIGWFPEQRILFVGDGFYASLAKRYWCINSPIISRIRCDAAIYEKPPARKKGQCGRPRLKGKRLPVPKKMAKRIKNWKETFTFERGKIRKRKVHTRQVIWYSVNKKLPILLVISRDPEGIEKDDFFFTTDISMEPAKVISLYADRWSIEDTFRNAKQYLGIQEPQSWKFFGPERVAAFGYFIYGLVWMWFIKFGEHEVKSTTPWYPQKCRPSFLDALAGIRRLILKNQFNVTVLNRAHMEKMVTTLIDTLARVA